jgi:hypothetical protein
VVTHGHRHRLLPSFPRSLLLALATAGLLVGGTAGPAAADTPVTWEEVPEVSVLGFLLVLVILPVGLAAIIALLTVLPSMARDRGYEPGASWRGDAEWFGAPTRGVAAADDVTAEQLAAGSKDAGGTSGRW